MKIILYGSTQIAHISELFKSKNIKTEVIAIENSGDSIYSIIKDKIRYFMSFLKAIKNADYIYKVYGYTRLDIFLVISKICRKKSIIHWIGTDVIEVTQNLNRISTKINNKLSNINLSGSALLKKELFEIGIDSNEIPIIPSVMFNADAKMPSQHAVLVYAPEGREEFYGLNYINRLAIEHPGIKFNVVANTGKINSPINVTYHGRLSLEEMNKMYNEITILFRFPKHDGLSMMLLEALVKGKYVIYPYEFPFVETPKSREYEDVKCVFNEIINNRPSYNHEASKFIKQKYSQDNIFGQYKEILYD